MGFKVDAGMQLLYLASPVAQARQRNGALLCILHHYFTLFGDAETNLTCSKPVSMSIGTRCNFREFFVSPRRT